MTLEGLECLPHELVSTMECGRMLDTSTRDSFGYSVCSQLFGLEQFIPLLSLWVDNGVGLPGPCEERRQCSVEPRARVCGNEE